MEAQRHQRQASLRQGDELVRDRDGLRGGGAAQLSATSRRESAVKPARNERRACPRQCASIECTPMEL